MRAAEIILERHTEVTTEAVLLKNLPLLALALRKYKDGIRIYRGINEVSPIVWVDPSKGPERRSISITNYYTLLLDHLPSWKGYPPRGFSLIGSTNENDAGIYAEDQPHVVLPLGDPVLGVCPAGDIWHSFDYLMTGIGAPHAESLDWFNDWLELVAHDLGVRLSDSSFTQMKAGLDKMTEKFATSMDSKKRAAVARWFKAGDNILTTLNTYMAPALNKFHKTKLSRFTLTDAREIWLSAPCFLVQQRVLEAFLKTHPL